MKIVTAMQFNHMQINVEYLESIIQIGEKAFCVKVSWIWFRIMISKQKFCFLIARKCPKGAIFKICSSPCKLTCKNYKRPRHCNKICQPGCDCPYGKVWHNNKCVDPEQCLLPITWTTSNRNEKQENQGKS